MSSWNLRSRKRSRVFRFGLPILLIPAILVSACSGQPTDVDTLLASGGDHLEAGEVEAAIEDLEAAVETDPENEDAHFLLGKAYHDDGELQKASEQFETVISIAPENGAAHHNLGVIFLQMQAPERAIAELEIALGLDPESAETQYQLGASYLTLAVTGSGPESPPDTQQLEEAAGYFEAALENRADMPEALIGLGNVYTFQEDFDQAIEMLQRAVSQVPESTEAWFALGRACAQSGDVEAACEAYRNFMALDPPENWKTEVQTVMLSLGCE